MRCASPAAYFDEIKDVKLDAKLFGLVTTLIGERTKEWDPAMVHDPVQEKLREMIAAKAAHKTPLKTKPAQEPSGNVVSIMDALRKSIAEDKHGPNGRAKKR